MSKPLLVIMPLQMEWNRLADFQRQTALELSKTHTVIIILQAHARFFLRPAPEVGIAYMPRVIFFQPGYIIPFRRFAVIDRINQLINLIYLCKSFGRGKKKVLWIFDPHFWFYTRVKSFISKVTTLYDCVDYLWHPDPKIRKKIQVMEQKLIKEVDCFFVNSSILFTRHKKVRLPTAIVPQGNRFNENYVVRSLKKYRKPIIGFIGSFDYRFDFRLIEHLVVGNPTWNFRFWGSVQGENDHDQVHIQNQLHYISQNKNVEIGYSTDPHTLAQVIQSFSVAIIPYLPYPIVRYGYPMKLFEYFYFGKPVVASNIHELKRFPKYVYIAENYDLWQRNIELLTGKRWPTKYKAEQRKLAIKNGWNQKVDTILKLLP